MYTTKQNILLFSSLHCHFLPHTGFCSRNLEFLRRMLVSYSAGSRITPWNIIFIVNIKFVNLIRHCSFKHLFTYMYVCVNNYSFTCFIACKVIFQLSLVEREINEVIRGAFVQQRQPSSQYQNVSTDARDKLKQKAIAEDDICPICQDELLCKSGEPLTYCK